MSKKVTVSDDGVAPPVRKDPHLAESIEQYLGARRAFELYGEHRNDLMLLAAFDAIEIADREAAAITGPTDPLRRGRVALRDEIHKAMVVYAEASLRQSARNVPAGERLMREDLIVDKMGGAYLYLRHLQKMAAADPALIDSLPSPVARQVRLRVARASQGAISDSAIVRAWSETFLMGPDGLPWRNLVAEVERRGKELRDRVRGAAASAQARKSSRSGAAWRDAGRLNISKKRVR